MQRLVSWRKGDCRPVDFKIAFPTPDDPQWQRCFANFDDGFSNKPTVVLEYNDSTMRPARVGYSFDCIDEFAMRQRLKDNIAISRVVNKKLPQREDVPIDAHGEQNNNDYAAPKPSTA
jgi:hypothetical protein